MIRAPSIRQPAAFGVRCLERADLSDVAELNRVSRLRVVKDVEEKGSSVIWKAMG